MSPRLAFSIAISTLTMAAFVLFSTAPASEPFGEHRESGAIRAELAAPVPLSPALFPRLAR